jgi:glutamate racemase
MNTRKKIGIFDSGVGGTLMLKALSEHYREVDYLYVGDTLNMPYGKKTPEEIFTLTERIVVFLLAQNVDACFIACHTIAAVAQHHLTQRFKPMPFIGLVEMTAYTAARKTTRGIIGIIGTPLTIATHAHRDILSSLNQQFTIIEKSSDRLAESIERYYDKYDYLKRIVEEDFSPLIAAGVDCIILACTHYPLIREIIASVVGPSVTLVTGLEMLDTIGFFFDTDQRVNADYRKTTVDFFVTDNNPNEFVKKVDVLLQWSIENIRSMNI